MLVAFVGAASIRDVNSHRTITEYSSVVFVATNLGSIVLQDFLNALGKCCCGDKNLPLYFVKPFVQCHAVGFVFGLCCFSTMEFSV